MLLILHMVHIICNTGHMMKSIYELAISLVQHHQGITGTSRQHVANDYAKKLYKGRESCYESSKEEIQKIFDISKDFKTCDFLNVTICDLSEPGFTFGVIKSSVFYWLIYKPIKTQERIPMSSP